jgi:hypothetical protein
VDDLYSLDPELYRGIMSLKAIARGSSGDGSVDEVAALDLNFETTTSDDMHGSQVRPPHRE